MDNMSQYHIQICVEARDDILDIQYTKGATVQHVLETACKMLGIDDSWNYALYSRLFTQWLSESYSCFEEEGLLLRKKTPEYYRLTSGSEARSTIPHSRKRSVFNQKTCLRTRLQPETIYLSTVLFTADNKLLMTAGSHYYPTVEISRDPQLFSILSDESEEFNCAFRTSLDWLAQPPSSPPSEKFWSNCFNRAVEKLRNEIALPHLGVVYDHVVIMTSSKAKFIVTVQYLPYSSKDEFASDIVKSGILKWKSLDELNAIYTKDSHPIWTNCFSFWCSRKSKLSPGLYVGLLHTESSLQSMRVLVQKDRKQFIPLEKIRDEASISSEEASWIKSLSGLNPDGFENLVDSIKEDAKNENENSLILTNFQRAFVESYYKLQSDTKLMWDSGDIYGEHTVDVYYNQETRQMFSILEDLDKGQYSRITETEPSGATDSGGKAVGNSNEQANARAKIKEHTLFSPMSDIPSNTTPSLTVTSPIPSVADEESQMKYTFYPFSLFDALQHSTLNTSLHSSSRRAMQILHASQGYFSRELVRCLRECNITLDNAEPNVDDCLLDPQVLGSLPDVVKSIKSALDIIREETILLKNQWHAASWSMSVIEWDRQRTMGRYSFDQPSIVNKCSFGRSTYNTLRKGAQMSQAIVPVANNRHTSTIDTCSRIGFLLETMKHAPDRAWSHIRSINAPIPIVRFGNGDTFITKAKLDPILANFLASTLFIRVYEYGNVVGQKEEERDDDAGEVDKYDSVKEAGKVGKKGKKGKKESRKTETKKKASRKNIMRSLGFGSGKNGNDINNASGDSSSAEEVKKPISKDMSKMKINGELSKYNSTQRAKTDDAKVDRDTLSKSYFSPLTFSLPNIPPLFLDDINEDKFTSRQSSDNRKKVFSNMISTSASSESSKVTETLEIPVKYDKRVEPELSGRRIFDTEALKFDITTQRDYLNEGLSDVLSGSSNDSSAPVSSLSSTLTPISINISANPSAPAKLASPQPTTPTNSLMDYFSHTKKKDRAQLPTPSSSISTTPDERDAINYPNSDNAIQSNRLTSIGSAGSDEHPTSSLVLSSPTTEREGPLPFNRTTNPLAMQNNKISKLKLNVQNSRKTGGTYSKSAPSSPLTKGYKPEPFPFEISRLRRKGVGDMNEEDKCESEKINDKIQNDPLMKFVTPAFPTTSSSAHSLSTLSDPQQKQTLHPQTPSPPPPHSQKSSTSSRPVILRSGTLLNTSTNSSSFVSIPPPPRPPSPTSLAKLKNNREDLRKIVTNEKISGKNEIERLDGIINGSGEEKGEKLEGLPDKYRRRERIIRMWEEASLEESSSASKGQYEKLTSSSLQGQQRAQQQTAVSDRFSFRSPTSPTCFTSPNSPTSPASNSSSQSFQLFSDDSSSNRMYTTRARAKSVSEAYQKRQKSERKFRENVFAS
ncbi:4777_t:CDS:2 [Paraglomus brasilianum]|uniref:4777_t:CDS:1 n=1 Tax=Paraglomus brasilianum TaxID=144538 RepID=A0A9N9AMF4_9GLOM|nr:4777_t:CDS:2 [Paraglomus brasilianum]